MANWCQSNDVNYATYTKRFSLNPLVAYQLKQLCQANRFTHIHTHDSHSHTFAVMAIQLFKITTPLIVHRRVDFPIKENGLSPWKYNHPSIKAIICVSGFIHELIKPAIRQPQLITTIHSGIDLSKEDDTSQTHLRQEFDIPTEDSIIINLAAIAPHKDYFTFVDTAAILLGKGLKATFLLVGGDGGEAKAIQEHIDKTKHASKIKMTGFRKDVAGVLSQSDLFLFTSKTEGLGGAVLDALKAGVPVVSTAVGGVMEIIENGQTGLVAPIGEPAELAAKVQELIADKSLQKKLIENGKQKIQAFSKEQNAIKILKVYQSVLASK